MLLYDAVGGEGHVLLIGTHYDDVMAVVADAGGHGTLLQAIALDVAQTDVVGVLMTLDDGDLQNVIVHVDTVGVAAVSGGDLAVDHANDRVGTAVGEIGGGQRGHMEGVVGAVDQIGVDLRDGEVRHHAMVYHQYAALVDLFDVKVAKVVDDDEVRQIAGCNGAAVVQQEVAGSVVAGGLDGGNGVGAQGDGLFDDVVDVTLFQQVVGVLVIGAEHTAFHILVAQQGDQRFQIAGCGALADHNELAALELCDGVVQVVALVVGVHAGGDVGVQVVAHQVGGVAVDLLVMRLAGHDLLHHLGIAVDGANEVHHLGQTLYTGMVIEAVDSPVVQVGAGLVQRRGRHAGGQHKAHVHGQVLGGLEHILDAIGAHDVGDLVGVGDDGGGAMGQHRLGKLRGTDQGTLQMDVGVHKAGEDDLTAHIYLCIAAVFTHAYDQPLGHGDVAVTQLIGEYIDIGGVFQHQVGLFTAGGHGDDPQLFRQLPVDLAGIALFYCHNGTAPFSHSKH